MKFNITKEQLREIVEFTHQELPCEACGILSGEISGENLIVKRIWKFKNELNSSSRFYVSKEKVDIVISNINKLNDHLIAIFHSHPTALAIPSYQDIKYHLDPKVLMVIVSFAKNKTDIKCYQITENEYLECEILTVNQDS
ncbi:Mov34/MPN/PAD-1 family protein [Heyndrickxia sp. NPDC080065]|uniref:Mov34/MPN/PAD-1 family protein n=1 Tax=Heyndrickxia sp. NPDC080065 TaxID=3390568 RepID=UPI003D071281